MKSYPVEGEGLYGRRARMTGEFRAPKKGEYFLSGTKPMAYLAPNDFSESSKFFICRLLSAKVKL